MQKPIRRTIAKYAFNILAYIRGAEFVLRPSFNALRDFVLNGTEGGFVQFGTDQYNLRNYSPLGNSKEFVGNVFAIEAQEGQLMVGLAFFGLPAFRVTICRDFAEPFPQRRFAHQIGTADLLEAKQYEVCPVLSMEEPLRARSPSKTLRSLGVVIPEYYL